ncbi:MAG: hypothetical protein JWO82_2790 [Akkermansiaceae bacterium]|nr:hypothetical protein [Akkermansiaceae bacterium]
MKTENEQYEEIGGLLRSARGAEATPPPGLEARILRRLKEDGRTRGTGWWSGWWLLLPATGAAAVLVLLSGPPAAKTGQKTVAETKVEVPVVVRAPVESMAGLLEANPLKVETLALGRDADRAEGFLWECLPSFRGMD